MAPLTPNDRQRRILQLSQEWGIEHPATPSRLIRPQQPPSFRNPADDQAADDFLHRRALEAAQIRPKGGLSRAFSSSNLKRGKNAEPRELVEALSACVANGGSPGVAEALLAKLAASGVDLGLNSGNKTKSGMLSRRKSMDAIVDRTKLLRLAVDQGHLDMMRVLLPYADPVALDVCLPHAVRMSNAQSVELLLMYGAKLSQTADGQDSFRQCCLLQGQARIISLIINSEGRPSQDLLSKGLVDAVGSGDLLTVLHLTRSSADGDYNKAEALKIAVKSCRQDLALALIMGNKPPQRPGVDEAFAVFLEITTLTPQARLQMAELLLCAGARGPILSRALQDAWSSQFLQMANLLAAHGGSTGDDDATVLKDAISKEEFGFVESLLAGSSVSPAVASQCVSSIPKHASSEMRSRMLKLLLKSGANGDPLHEMLIEAVEAGDLACVGLLLKPYVRERMSVNGSGNGNVQTINGRGFKLNGTANGHANGDANGHPNGHSNDHIKGHTNGLANGNGQDQAYFRHAIASTDYKSGEAIRTAILRGNTIMVTKLLEGKPSHDTLTKVFPLISKLAPDARYEMVQVFLPGALFGPSLHAALQEALAGARESRDANLIELLVDHNADINFKQGAGLQSVIRDGDMELLGRLLQKASPQTAAARIPDAMAVSDHRARHDMMSILLRAGAAIGQDELSSALLATLEEPAVDLSLLRLLLQTGSANINRLDGAIIRSSIINSDPKVTEMVFGFGKPTPESITVALSELGPLPSTESKCAKLQIVLSKSTQREDLGAMLITEVQSLIKNRRQSTSLSTLKLLIDSGADPNAYNAAVIHHAVRGTDSQITDLLFASPIRPTPVSLGSTLPHALRISDPMDRLTFTTRLVKAGADPLELNRALMHAIQTYPEDLSLIGVLAGAADASDGEALGMAVSKEVPDVVDLLLSRTSHSEDVRSSLIDTALNISDRDKRREICAMILNAGIPPVVTSSALLIAARDGDLALGDVLIAHGATISPSSPSPIIEACRHGSTAVLEVLLKANPSTDPGVLVKGFQAATEVGDLNKRAVIFEQLLARGVKGDILDMQLGSAARYGDHGHEILRVLLQHGADPNYNGGDAVIAATKSAFLQNLELLLGLWDEGHRQKRPSAPTLNQSLKASWNLNPDTRFKIITNLGKAGLVAGDELHIALNDAVNEEEPEERLIKLLLDHGASPTANGCKTLVDATQRGSGTCFDLLSRDVSPDNLGQVFAQVFAEDKFDSWFDEHGFDIARSFIGRGVAGVSVSVPLVKIMKTGQRVSPELAGRFVDLLLSAAPEVNYNHGEPLCLAASQASVPWTSTLLQQSPTVETLSFAFQHIFDTPLPEDEALSLFRLFADYQNGETRIDVTLQQPGVEPMLVRAMTQYPRKTTILETLLDAGLYHDQMTKYKIHDDVEDDEEMTLLCWAIAQPQKKISPAVIEVLLERGANVNVRTSLSRTTPLMLAVQTLQPEVARMLLLQGADVDVSDYKERTPLAMATATGGDIGTKMMGNILAAEPSIDDGSLHNAARALNLPAVRVLVQGGHDPDFPSASHGGRSALGEVCLSAANGDKMDFDSETRMQKIMSFLVDAKCDLAVKSHGKSLLHLCFESRGPLTTTRLLLKVAMWKHINKSFNNYTDGKYTYSPSMYITKFFPPSEVKDQLLALLRANRAQDVFYANSGPQPDDAIGLPADMEVAERGRRARLSRLAEESEDFALTLARRRELASVEKQIQADKAEMEDARRRRLHSEDLSTLRSRAHLTNSLEETAFQRRLSEQHRLADQATNHARTTAAQQLNADDTRQKKMLEWEAKLNTEKVGNARALTQLRLGEREEVERMEKKAEERMQRRLEAQRQVVESQDRLARRLANGPAMTGEQRRQIGYVSEELN